MLVGCTVKAVDVQQPEPVVVPLPTEHCVVIEARNDLGVMEEWENGGPEVDEYLRSVKLGTGFYWCAAFVHAKHRECGIVLEPAREFASALRFSKENIVWKRGQKQVVPFVRLTKNGYVYTMNHGGGKGHIGFVCDEDEEDVTGYEGNTNNDGSRNGVGVFKRIRNKEVLWTMNNWLGE